MGLTILDNVMKPFGSKKAIPLIPLRLGSAFWEKGHPRNLSVGFQKFYGSNKQWKTRFGYHKRSMSETAMHRVKKLLEGTLSLRNYNAQVGKLTQWSRL